MKSNAAYDSLKAELQLIKNMIIHRYTMPQLQDKTAAECVRYALEQNPISGIKQ